MAKHSTKDFSLPEIIAASFTTHMIILDALIAQGAVDKAVLTKFLNDTIENQHPEPLKPSLQHLLGKIVDHLEGGAPIGKVTLQ